MENNFIPYETALEILAEYTLDFSPESRNLEDCTGRVLAEPLVADRDFPPFDRVTMDGIALRYEAFRNGRREFAVCGIAPAGTPQLQLDDPEGCIEVMTGAILPGNTDTVVRYEDLEIHDGKASIVVDDLTHRQNIHFQGIDLKKGHCIVPEGTRMGSAEINIAAAVGKPSLLVRRMPRAAVISTGDELVEIDRQPALHQIRRSNVYGIQSTLQGWGMQTDLKHLADDKASMLQAIGQWMKEYEVLVFTGGVSKGKFDYLPEVLDSLQVKKHFHKIQQRPGKPFWFGTHPGGSRIFALPGNPVSSFVCVYVYLKYWLDQCLGMAPRPLYVTLKKEVQFKPDLVYFLEARLESTPDGQLLANPLQGNGSGDFANLVLTDGFLVLPQGKSLFQAGETYLFVPYRSFY